MVDPKVLNELSWKFPAREWERNTGKVASVCILIYTLAMFYVWSYYPIVFNWIEIVLIVAWFIASLLYSANLSREMNNQYIGLVAMVLCLLFLLVIHKPILEQPAVLDKIAAALTILFLLQMLLIYFPSNSNSIYKKEIEEEKKRLIREVLEEE